MPGPTNDVWEALATARAIRRFTDEPVDQETLDRCLEAATWAPNGANAQLWRFIILDSAEQAAVVAEAAQIALQTIESIYGMTRPADDDHSRAARNNRATYELHDRAGERTSVLFTAFRNEFASDFLQGGSIYPAMQNFYLAARAQGLGACFTSWASYGGEQLHPCGGRGPRRVGPGGAHRRGVASRPPRPGSPTLPLRRRVQEPLGRRAGRHPLRSRRPTEDVLTGRARCAIQLYKKGVRGSEGASVEHCHRVGPVTVDGLGGTRCREA